MRHGVDLLVMGEGRVDRRRRLAQMVDDLALLLGRKDALGAGEIDCE